MKYFKLLNSVRQILALLLAFAIIKLFAMTPVSPEQPAFSHSPLLSGPASILGWVPSPDNICGGYYLEPAIVRAYPNPLPVKQQITTITANQSAYFSQTANSVLQGNVVVTQPGRQVTADVAHLQRNQQTGNLQTINLEGNVHFWESGKLVVAKKAYIDLQHKIMTLGQVVYRVMREFKGHALDAWGTASEVDREPSGVLNFQQGTYSTCPPTKDIWQIKASRLTLDKENGWGRAIHSRLDVFGMPVAYLPYFTFPLDNRRKTGFLFPTMGYSNTNGIDFSLPFYLNLAPNYDATLTPRLISNRGIQYNVLSRYLTPKSDGVFNLSVLPSDRLFRQFQANGPQTLAGVPDGNVYLSHLEKDSDTRSFFAYNDNTIFNPHWSTALNLNYVSDDYYFQNFGSTVSMATTDQLLNRSLIQYQGENWRFSGLLQTYETLHPYTDPQVQDQYSRVPDLNLSGDFPEQSGLDYHLDTQLVRFDHRRDFITGKPIVTGSRFNLQPSVSLPIEKADGYFIPELQVAGTFYSLQNQLPYNPGTPNNISRVIPVFDIDSGLLFERGLNIGTHPFQQTLEPRIYYLLVPLENQSDIPEFDTTLPPTDVSQFFRPNRFVGIDRIGDANQVSLGLTTRLLDDFTNAEKAHASIAEAFYIQPQKVADEIPNPANPQPHDHNSPLVGELGYNLTSQWNMLANTAWDPNREQVSNTSVSLTYSPSAQAIFSTGYNFVRGGDVSNINSPGSAVNNLSRFNVSAAIPLNENWSAVGNWNYNISHSYAQSYFYGLEYQSCCWAVRVIASRIITAENPTGSPQFETDYYVQLQLKGLGNIGNSDPGALLASALPGYQDSF